MTALLEYLRVLLKYIDLLEAFQPALVQYCQLYIILGNLTLSSRIDTPLTFTDYSRERPIILKLCL